MIDFHIIVFKSNDTTGDEKDRYFKMPVVPRVGEEIWIPSLYYEDGSDPTLDAVKITEVQYRAAADSDGGFSVNLYGEWLHCL